MRRKEEALEPRSGQALLRVQDVGVRFGGIVALDRVSFEVAAGQIVGLIGPNGAGKTTLFNCVSRLYPCDSGEITFGPHRLLEVPRHRIATLGIGRTFQNLALFRSMTVLENVLVGRHSRTRSGFFAFIGLEAVAATRVSDLSFGTQKRVELARALASEPTLLLLDEPASGLNHEEVTALGSLIREIRDRLRLTVLLVEHHMNLVMSISDRVVALNFGRKIAEGTPEDVRSHPEVMQAYLGSA